MVLGLQVIVTPYIPFKIGLKAGLCTLLIVTAFVLG